MAAPVRLAFSVLKNKSTLKLFTHQSSLRLRTHCIVGRSLTYEHWNRVEKWHQSHYYENLWSQDDKKDEYKKALEQLAKTDQVTLLLKKAKLAEHKQDFQKAEDLYHQALAALKMFQQQKTWDDDKLLDAHIFIYDGMANLAMARLQFSKAENLFKETMRGLLQKGFLKEDNALVEISLKLAMIYAALKRNTQAESGYMFCINTQEKKVSDNPSCDENTVALYGLCTDSYSRFLLVQKRYDEAETKLKQALDIATQIHGQYHVQVAVLFNDLATLQSLQKHYTEAKRNVINAVQVARKVESPDLPIFVCNLGLVNLHLLLLDEANKQCNHALQLARKTKQEFTEREATKCLKSIDQIRHEQHEEKK